MRWLSLAVWCLLLLSVCLASSPLFSEEDKSCNNAGKHDNPCQFVRDNCLDDNFLISYMELYYCDWPNYSGLFFTTVIFWVVILFYLLYTIADNHFTVSLQALSDFFKLSPDMAGLTFLAFGNGAPDFFTSFAGVERNTSLILSGSVGSGLFITCLVLGAVILASSDPVNPEDAIKNSVKSDNPRVVSPYPFFRNIGLYFCCLIYTFVICLVKEVKISFDFRFITPFLQQ